MDRLNACGGGCYRSVAVLRSSHYGHLSPADHCSPVPPNYTPHEGLIWKSRKLGVFGRKLEGIHSPVIVILINIGENNILMYFLIDMKYAGDQDYKQ